MKKPTYYITTPIYYPSGKWHIGHCYTTVCADAMARYKRMAGYDVFYLTGTDEHGQKIEKRAAEAGQSPKQFVDALVDEIKKLWSILDISYDKYIRTTDDYHKAAVQKIFKTLYDKGDIYKAAYKGKYCTPCEAFFTEKQLNDGKCPDCGREVSDSEEECYFFRLSKYEDKIKKLLKQQAGFLEPSSRVNEMLNNFVNDGLEDLAVSRSNFSWGVPVPIENGSVIYVWIDALSNYITALGYNSADDSLYKKYWPADLHLMAKEIVRFHAIVWPAILLALDEPLPKRIFGHGWILFDGDKMSKSKGNVVDPFILTERYGADALRYFLLREISFGADSNYSSEMFLTRINTDLANDLGNLCKRTLAMSEQYFGGKIFAGESVEAEDADIIQKINSLYSAVEVQLEKLNINRAIEAVFALIGRANKYIDETRPWVLNKEGNKERLRQVMFVLCEAIRVSATLLMPFLTVAPKKIFEALGLNEPSDFANAAFNKIKNYNTKQIETLFPRLDVAKELDELSKINNSDKKENEPKVDEKAKECEVKQEITIDEFFKTQLRVAKVVAAEKVEKADKLLKLTLDVGGEERTVVSGIAKSYTPAELIGKEVILVANLKPAKLRGIESCGMILCATGADGKVILVSPEKTTGSGAEVC